MKAGSVIRWVFVSACAGLIGMIACSSSPKPCPGGVLVDGACVGKCTPDQCKTGNTCVANECKLVCNRHDDCPTGKECVSANEDDSGKAIQVCAPAKVTGFGTPCPNGDECAPFGTCPDGSGCDASLCGGKPADCKDGKCPDGADCEVQCNGAGCTTLTCHGSSIGHVTIKGDADAYCAPFECHADGDCGAGYYCGLVNSARRVCEVNWLVDSKNGKVDIHDDLCGFSKATCIKQNALTELASTAVPGTVCPMYNVCLKRDKCAVCETNLDCARVPSQACATMPNKGGGKRCVSQCRTLEQLKAAKVPEPINPDMDCGFDSECKDGACIPRFGSCAGDADFCEPCVTDLDCGDAWSGRQCQTLYGGERACSNRKACKSSSDCLAPSGKKGKCSSGTCQFPQVCPVRRPCTTNVDCVSDDGVNGKCSKGECTCPGAQKVESCW